MFGNGDFEKNIHTCMAISFGRGKWTEKSISKKVWKVFPGKEKTRLDNEPSGEGKRNLSLKEQLENFSN